MHTSTGTSVFQWPDKGQGTQGLVATYLKSEDRALVLTMKGPTPPLEGPRQPSYEWMNVSALTEAMAHAPGSQSHGYVRFSVDSAGAPPSESGGHAIALTSHEGQKRLARATKPMLRELTELMPFFEPQPNVSFCNIRTLAMFLNAMQLPMARKIIAAKAEQGDPVPLVTEQDILREVDALPLRDKEGKRRFILADRIHFPRGAFMDEMAAMDKHFGAGITLRHVNPTARDYRRFRKEAIGALKNGDAHIMVQFDRAKVGQMGAGHYSALAAYDKKTDSFLLYDTAPFKVDAAWLPARELLIAPEVFPAQEPRRAVLLHPHERRQVRLNPMGTVHGCLDPHKPLNLQKLV
jgi:hypothetical protein